MNRRFTLLGALALLTPAGLLSAQGGAPKKASAPAGGATRAAGAPRFEVDPMWPKPMGNRWILGSTTGVAIDSRDHIFVVHLTDSFTQRNKKRKNLHSGQFSRR